MFEGKALGWMAGTLIWMPGARRVHTGQMDPLNLIELLSKQGSLRGQCTNC